MNTQPTPGMFLALTALEEFWDTSRPILFLGEWCKDHKKKRSWEKLNANVLKSEELNYAKSYQAYQFAVNTYEKLLPQVAAWMNEFHGTHYSLKYWRLLIGPFLFWHTQVIYERFLYLRAVYHQYPNIETYGLAQENFWTPLDTNEFTCFVCISDAFNLQLLTQLLNLSFKRPILYKTAIWENELNHRKRNFSQSKYSFKTKIFIMLIQAINKIKRSQTVGLLDGLSPRDMVKLMFQSQFRILPLLPTMPINRGQTLGKMIFIHEINKEKRQQLLQIPFDNELSKLVVHTLPVNMPSNFIESYHEGVEASQKYFPYQSKVILLESCASYDQYKFWVGKQLENGSKLVGYQHGGCYGMQKASSAEYLERHVSDFFISWGWSDKNVLPAPVSYMNRAFLSDFYEKRKQLKINEVLWVATQSNLRYQLTIHSWSIPLQFYLSYQRKFLDALESKTLKEICMRLDPATNLEEVREHLPNLNMYLPMNRDSFFTHLSRVKIAVIDNASTAFLYTLALNIPTILFWDKEYWMFREEAKPYLEMLEQAGIYYEQPENAAKKLNKIADDPYSWWNSDSIQQVRQQFCKRFVLVSDNYLHDWQKILLGLSQWKENLGSDRYLSKGII